MSGFQPFAVVQTVPGYAPGWRGLWHHLLDVVAGRPVRTVPVQLSISGQVRSERPVDVCAVEMVRAEEVAAP